MRIATVLWKVCVRERIAGTVERIAIAVLGDDEADVDVHAAFLLRYEIHRRHVRPDFERARNLTIGDRLLHLARILRDAIRQVRAAPFAACTQQQQQHTQMAKYQQDTQWQWHMDTVHTFFRQAGSMSAQETN